MSCEVFAACSLLERAHLTSAFCRSGNSTGVGKKTKLEVDTEGRVTRDRDTLQEEKPQLARGISDQQQEHIDSVSCLVVIVGIPAQTHSLSHFSVQRSEQTGFPQAEKSVC